MRKENAEKKAYKDLQEYARKNYVKNIGDIINPYNIAYSISLKCFKQHYCSKLFEKL